MARDIIRRCRFSPYQKGTGPSFSLIVWDSGLTNDGRTVLGYELRQHDREPRKRTAVVFTGQDFRGSPMHADDSDRTIGALMGFLTLQKGDTDAEYFANYTPLQLDFSRDHGEALAWQVMNRFGVNQ